MLENMMCYFDSLVFFWEDGGLYGFLVIIWVSGSIVGVVLISMVILSGVVYFL